MPCGHEGDPLIGSPTRKHPTGVIFAPLLIFFVGGVSRLRTRPETLSLVSATFEKVDETFGFLLL